MIYVLDDFLPESLLVPLQDYLNQNEFEKVTVGDKDFHIQNSNKELDDYISLRLSAIEGKTIQPILSFFRIATDSIDNTWRIHSDLNINGQKPDRAIVLYLSPRESEELHGTALWEHETYGRELPANTTDEEYDRMITGDAEDIGKWRLNTVIGYGENRLVCYPSSYFHSKYPNVAWKQGRKVFVMFYNTHTS